MKIVTTAALFLCISSLISGSANAVCDQDSESRTVNAVYECGVTFAGDANGLTACLEDTLSAFIACWESGSQNLSVPPVHTPISSPVDTYQGDVAPRIEPTLPPPV